MQLQFSSTVPSQLSSAPLQISGLGMSGTQLTVMPFTHESTVWVQMPTPHVMGPKPLSMLLSQSLSSPSQTSGCGVTSFAHGPHWPA